MIDVLANISKESQGPAILVMANFQYHRDIESIDLTSQKLWLGVLQILAVSSRG